MIYAIHFTDGVKMGSLTLDGAMRLIAIRHRVMCRDLITDTTEEKISVWFYPSESSIAEVIVSGRDSYDDILRARNINIRSF